MSRGMGENVRKCDEFALKRQLRGIRIDAPEYSIIAFPMGVVVVMEILSSVILSKFWRI